MSGDLIFLGPLPVPWSDGAGGQVGGVTPTGTLPPADARSPVLSRSDACDPFWRVRTFALAIDLTIEQSNYAASARGAGRQMLTGNFTLQAAQRTLDPGYPPDIPYPTGYFVGSEDLLPLTQGIALDLSGGTVTGSGTWWDFADGEGPPMTLKPFDDFDGRSLALDYFNGYYLTPAMDQAAILVSFALTGIPWRTTEAMELPLENPSFVLGPEDISGLETATLTVDLGSNWPTHSYTLYPRSVPQSPPVGALAGASAYYVWSTTGTIALTALEFWSYGGTYDTVTGERV